MKIFLVGMLYFSLIFSYQYREESIDLFTTAHILEFDIREYEMKSVRAREIEGIKREVVSSMVEDKGAIAGINGGFWKENGDPAGALKVDGKWLNLPTRPRGAIGWNKDSSVLFMDRLLVSEEGDQVTVLPQLGSKKDWDNLDYIVGGIPLVVYEGEIRADFSQEVYTVPTFTSKKHSRTAVGFTEDGQVFFVVVDGHYTKLGGMTMDELAQYMYDLGCDNALNLDGGSSSVMVLEGEVLNKPFAPLNLDGTYEQKVSHSILIFKKQ